MYGEETIMTSKIMIDYGLTLVKSDSTKNEGESVLKEALLVFKSINDQIPFKDDCDLLFNLHYNYLLSLNDISDGVDGLRDECFKELAEQTKTSKGNKIIKEALLTIQRTACLIEEDHTKVLEELRRELKNVTSNDSNLPKLSHLSLMLKFFTAPILLRMENYDEAMQVSNEILKDIKTYFGHEMTDMVLEPKLIQLNYKFRDFMMK